MRVMSTLHKGVKLLEMSTRHKDKPKTSMNQISLKKTRVFSHSSNVRTFINFRRVLIVALPASSSDANQSLADAIERKNPSTHIHVFADFGVHATRVS